MCYNKVVTVERGQEFKIGMIKFLAMTCIKFLAMTLYLLASLTLTLGSSFAVTGCFQKVNFQGFNFVI